MWKIQIHRNSITKKKGFYSAKCQEKKNIWRVFFATFAISSNLVKYAYGWWLFEQHHKTESKNHWEEDGKKRMATIHKKI